MTKSSRTKSVATRPQLLARSPQVTELRLTLHQNGYHPVPVSSPRMQIKSAGKRPTMQSWNTVCATANEEEIQRWARVEPDCSNTGLLCGEIIGVDIDVMDRALADEIVKEAHEVLGPTSLIRIGRAPKVLLVYRAAEPFDKLRTPELLLPDDTKLCVEILGRGQQFVGFGLHPDTGTTYEWPNQSPVDVAATDLPVVTRNTCADFVKQAEERLRSAGGKTKAERDDIDRAGRNFAKLGDDDKPSRELVEEALAFVPNSDLSYDEWIRIGYSLYAALGPDGQDLWRGWSAKSEKNDQAYTTKTWPGFANVRNITVGTLFWHAKQNGWWRRGGDTPGEALDGLVERTESDPGAPFAPEVLEALVTLKQNDQPAFERLRSNLKKIKGCRVSELDKAIAAASGDTGSHDPTQADKLIEIAASADLFHATDGTAYVVVEVGGHQETWQVHSTGFRRWLVRQFLSITGGAPNSEAMKSALNAIEARAYYDGPEHPVFVRVGAKGGRVYLDLCDDTWRAVEIDADGWRVVEHHPVRFRRASGMLPLPEPTRGGSIDELRQLLNVQSENDFTLGVAWLLGCISGRGPYPVLVLSGEQGSAKSTFAATMRAICDPNSAPLRALPRSTDDLFIAATNAHVLAFDNLSSLREGTSDTLCRLATGGGFGKRRLYADQDEVLFDESRPIVLNGITDFVERPDLADRAIFLTLEPISEGRRRSEADLKRVLETERPQILGALLDAVVIGLKQLPHTRLEVLPRMADFALWVTACETAMWAPGTFMAAYDQNRAAAIDIIIEGDLVGQAVRVFMAARTMWTGTATELLDALEGEVGEKVLKSKDWPTSPQGLSSKLRRAATGLRALGIDMVSDREGGARNRIIRITATQSSAEPENGCKTSSASSAGLENAYPDNDSGGSASADDADDQKQADSAPEKPEWSDRI